jgi:Glycosyl hydrolase family 65, N-terminal domain
MTSDELWFDRPANSWLQALPLGNGRIGVMAHGGVDVEHLQVNDGTAWSGSPKSEHAGTLVDADAAAAAISAARDAVAARTSTRQPVSSRGFSTVTVSRTSRSSTYASPRQSPEHRQWR